MADKKISALTSASTPLAGTEVLPIVQSGSTVKVAVKDILSAPTPIGSVAPNTGAFTTTTVRSGATLFINRSDNAVYNSIVYGSGDKFQFNQANGGTYNFAVGGVDHAVFDGTGNIVPKIAAKGVNFTANTPAAGMTSQLLNWYEEGTFTPVVADAATGGNTGTAALAKGRYTKVGRLVTVTISFLDISTSGMTAGNTLFVRGLPFASVTDAFVNFIGAQSNSQLASTSGAISPLLFSNSTAMYFVDGVAAGAGAALTVAAITSGQTDLYITMTYETA